MSQAASASLLDPPELRAVEQLRLNPRKSFHGSVRGERLTSRKGISIEFSDYRGYAHGDDLRHLDWNVLARLGTPVVKTYRDEQDLAVYLVLDCSASMAFGDPTKFDIAKKVLACLALPAFGTQDAVRLCVAGKRRPPGRVLRGMGGYPKLCRELSNIECDGGASLVPSLKEVAAALPRTGVFILASDGLDPKAADAVRFLGARGHEVWLAQILSDEELDPDIEGDLKLLDAEQNFPVEITASGQVLDLYKQNLRRHCDSLAAECRRVGGRYTQICNSDSLLAVIKDTFKASGWLVS